MIQRGGLLTAKLIESERQGIIFLYLGISPFPHQKKKRKRKKKAYFFEFESRIFQNIGPFKYVLHRKVNSHDKINLIIYFKILIIELNVSYVISIHVKFHLNKKLITFQSINTRQNGQVRSGLG